MSNEQDKPGPDAAPDEDAHAETAVLPEDALEKLLDEGEDPTELVQKAQAEAEENWNRYLRAVAEADNLRKRHARELERARNYGLEGLAGELLNVADSLEMGLEAAGSATVESLVEGKKATLKQLQAAMEKHGIESLYPEGEPFDPELHEAMTLQESDTAEPDTVIAVIQRGYRLNGRLLRPARVVVAKAPGDGD